VEKVTALVSRQQSVEKAFLAVVQEGRA
jgi:hypothetical protein